MNELRQDPSGFAQFSSDDIFELLPSQATLEQAKIFLASRGLSFSAGSWDFMIKERLRKHLKEGSISVFDLAEFLGECEEHGRQHVLLFKASKKERLRIFSDGFVESICKKEPRFPNFNERSVVKVPSAPTISEVRESIVEGQRCFIIKVIEKRHARDEKTYKEWEEGGRLFTSVETQPYRAANIVRIREDGLCEARVFSHADAYAYEIEARALIKLLTPMLDHTEYQNFTLRDARHFVCDPRFRPKAKEIFDLKHTEHLDNSDGRLRPSVSGPGRSMLENDGITKAMDAFGASGSTVHRAGLTLKRREPLNRGLNLGLSGADNEFFLTAQVTKIEYEYVLKTLLSAIEDMKSA